MWQRFTSVSKSPGTVAARVWLVVAIALFAICLPARVLSQEDPRTGPARQIEALFRAERAQAVASGAITKTCPELIERADALAVRAAQALQAGKLTDAQSLFMRARFSLPSLPTRLPAGISRFLGESRPRHADAVLCMAFHPAGTAVASGCRDGSVRIWEVPTGREQLQLQAHQGEVKALVFSPDGKMLLTAGDDREVLLWDLAKQAVISKFAGHQEPINALAISRDGTLIATGGGDRKLRLYNRADGKLLHDLPGHGLPINGISFSPDGKWVASACADLRLRIFDTATGGVKLAVPQFQGNQYGVVFLADSRMVALAGARPNRVLLIDTQDGSVRGSLEGHTEAVTGLSLSADNKRLATISDDRTARIYSVPEGKPLMLQALEDVPRALAISPDGTRLATGGLDRQVRWWELASTDQSRPLAGGGDGKTWCVAPLSGGLIVTGGQDGKLRLLRGEDGSLAKESSPSGGPITCIVSVEGSPSWLALGSADGNIRLADSATLEVKKTLASGHSSPISALAIDPASGLIASGDIQGRIIFWKLGEAKPALTLAALQGPVTALAFAGEGIYLAASTNDPVVRLYEVSSGKAVRSLMGSGCPVVSLVGLPKGNRLVAGCVDGLALVWNLDQAEGTPGAFKGHTQGATRVDLMPLTALACRSDGKLVASAGADRVVRLWDPATLEEWKALSGAGGWITGLAFDARGGQLAAVTAGGLARAWDLESSREQIQGLGHNREVKAMTYSPDGKILASTSQDQTTRLWDVASGRSLLVLDGVAAPSLAFGPGGKQLLVSGPERFLSRYSLPDGRPISRQPLGPGGLPNAMAVQGLKKRAVVWLGEGNLESWPLEGAGQREIWRLQEGSGQVSCLALSGTGLVVALGQRGGTVALFSLADQPVRQGMDLQAHQGPVLDASLDTPGGRLATADREGIAVWDVAGKRALVRIPTTGREVTFTLCLSPDGSLLASIGKDSVVRLHDSTTGKLLKSWAFPAPGLAEKPALRSLAFSPDGSQLAIGSAEGWICQADTK